MRKNFINRFISFVISFVFVYYTFADTTKVLFVGNSYTYVNDLPLLFKKLSASGGKIVYTDMSAPGGYTLEGHTTEPATLEKLNAGGWNYAVLQEQSQYPTIDFYRYNSMYPSAKKLDSIIHYVNANTVFYMTWGRKFGGEQCINNYCSPVFIDFFHMQDSLRSAYNEIAAILSAKVAPVGLGWKEALLQNPNVDLWQMDYSHPTLQGSYLGACIFYVTIFNQSPVGLNYYGGLSQQEALFFQNIAAGFIIGILKNEGEIPKEFMLYQNYPNPFNPETKIKFEIPPLNLPLSGGEKEGVVLKIYDILGREIDTLVDEELMPGRYEIYFNGTQLSSGLYYYKLTAGRFSCTKKMVLIK